MSPHRFVVGADDPWVDAERVRSTGARIPGAHYTLLDAVGHYPMEELDGFAMTLDGWLRELAAEGSVA